ncbi:hypothetical protein F5876DRAFT_77003 [Lentinula aff. lateritia]|uniref:Uncharacterized protein n=1 Tax=Lentinula aff. lateritia TaxID=2804960 RepID=A0ACC1TZH7_9AGAR|nr:hypothetical protein F5876DRAFT_77003 [Lentinula aff. lateritia]
MFFHCTHLSTSSRPFVVYLLLAIVLLNATMLARPNPILGIVPENKEPTVQYNSLKIWLGRIAKLRQSKQYNYTLWPPLEKDDKIVLFIGTHAGFTARISPASIPDDEDLMPWLIEPSKMDLSPPKYMPHEAVSSKGPWVKMKARSLVDLNIKVDFGSLKSKEESFNIFRNEKDFLETVSKVLKVNEVKVKVENECDYYDVMLQYMVKIEALDTAKYDLNRWEVLKARIKAVKGYPQTEVPPPNEGKAYTLSIKDI